MCEINLEERKMNQGVFLQDSVLPGSHDDGEVVGEFPSTG